MSIQFNSVMNGKSFQDMMSKYEEIKSTVEIPKGDVNSQLKDIMSRFNKFDANTKIEEILTGKQNPDSMMKQIESLVGKFNQQKPLDFDFGSLGKNKSVLEGVNSGSIGLDEETKLSGLDKNGDGKITASDLGLDSWSANIESIVKKYS